MIKATSCISKTQLGVNFGCEGLNRKKALSSASETADGRRGINGRKLRSKERVIPAVHSSAERMARPSKKIRPAMALKFLWHTNGEN